MLEIKSVSSTRRFTFLWSLSIALGWFAIPYPGLIFRNEAISSWPQIWSITINLLVWTLALGSVIGFLQYLLCRSDAEINWVWVLVSAGSYGLGTVVAFLLSCVLVVVPNPEVLSNQGSSFMFMPLYLMILFGGMLTAFIQSLFMRGTLFKDFREILSWSIAIGLGWEVGLFLSSFAWDAKYPIFAQSGLIGLIIALITALLFYVQTKTVKN